jgi:hypothetical protein
VKKRNLISIIQVRFLTAVWQINLDGYIFFLYKQLCGGLKSFVLLVDVFVVLDLW